MATDVITLWNQALSAIGGRGTVSSETENSREANTCSLWYSTVRDNVLKAAPWPCAQAYTNLATLATRSSFNDAWATSDPAPGWKYAYAEPTDLLAPRHLMSFQRFSRGVYDSSKAIFANEENAILYYTRRAEDVTKWDNGLERAVIFALAAHICLPITGKRTLARELQEEAFAVTAEAQTEIANEVDEHFDQLPSWVAARGYDQLPRSTKFVYPYESLNVVAL